MAIEILSDTANNKAGDCYRLCRIITDWLVIYIIVFTRMYECYAYSFLLMQPKPAPLKLRPKGAIQIYYYYYY